MFGRLKSIGRNIRRDVAVVRLVLKDKRTPLLPKILLGAAVGYLLSPIDIIPDWIPVLGQLDDAIIVPALVVLAMKMVPEKVIEDCRAVVREAEAK